MNTPNRFYKLFIPDHYDIYLDIDRSEKKITGTTTIFGEAKNEQIFLNQKFLNINSVEIEGKTVPFSTDNEAEAIKIDLPKTGKISLKVKYDTPLTDTMMGIYPSYYSVNGEKKQLIGTQFETTSARQAFPSVDEPEAKATFSLAIKFDEHQGETIIANMPENRVEKGVHYFEKTLRMSTYLLAFAFGELQKKETTTKSGIKIGVYATKAHQPKELDFAVDITKRAIEFYEDFYQTPYPLPHSWQIALPDFSAGAMENWGLITYREAYLLIDPDNTSLPQKEQVATVIAHELAHQWFGDLVTMKWWDDLWLNESFANMMEYVAIDAIEPGWRIWEDFQTSGVPLALQRDAIDGVQSVHVQVENPAEIDSIFDSAIVYAKGARMLVMVRSLIGDDNLRNGLKKYFAAHEYHNATGDDLWHALGEESGINVGQIMDSWLKQPGYPVVTAEVIDGNLTISQKQFFIGSHTDTKRKWQIPLNSNYSVAPQILKEEKISLGDYQQLRAEAKQPFRLNVGNDSHFIVKYDEILLDDLLANAEQLDNITQLQIIQDLRLLAEGQQISYAELVPLLPKFSKNNSNVVNSALYQVAKQLKQFVDPDTKFETNLQNYLDQISLPLVKKLGWHEKPAESIDDELTRPIVLSASLSGQNPETSSQAHQIFLDHRDHLEQLPASTRALVLINEMKTNGNVDLFEELLKSYQETSDPSYKVALRSAITSSKDPSLLAKTVANFKNADVIKPQDLRVWFTLVLSNPAGEQMAWDWFRDNWDWLSDTLGGDMAFSSFITMISKVLKTQKRLDEFKEFFEPKINTPGLTREITMDTRAIESRVKLITAEKETVNREIATIINE